eukprot:284819638_5
MSNRCTMLKTNMSAGTEENRSFSAQAAGQFWKTYRRVSKNCLERRCCGSKGGGSGKLMTMRKRTGKKCTGLAEDFCHGFAVSPLQKFETRTCVYFHLHHPPRCTNRQRGSIGKIATNRNEIPVKSITLTRSCRISMLTQLTFASLAWPRTQSPVPLQISSFNFDEVLKISPIIILPESLSITLLYSSRKRLICFFSDCPRNYAQANSKHLKCTEERLTNPSPLFFRCFVMENPPHNEVSSPLTRVCLGI